MTKECLIIDDDYDDQEIFMLCMEVVNKQINCTTANEGVTAIRMLSTGEYTPDYIFIDMNMPKMNGIECLKALKSMDRLRNTKMYMYSTTSDGSVLSQSRQLGADGFIVKPSSIKELQKKLSALFVVASGDEG